LNSFPCTAIFIVGLSLAISRQQPEIKIGTCPKWTKVNNQIDQQLNVKISQ
jgi:hypothetical protein